MKTKWDRHLKLLLFSTVLCALAGCTKVKALDSVSPLLEIKIADIPQIREAAMIGPADVTTTTLKFLDDTHIVVGMNFSSAPDVNGGQTFRATVVSNATIVIIDSRTGRVTNSKSWPSFMGEPAVSGKLVILPVGGGNFIAGVHNTILRLSRDFEVLAERQLVPSGAVASDGLHQDYWSIEADVKGRSAMLMRFSAELTEEDIWISPLTLSDQAKLALSTGYVHSICTLIDQSLVSNWNSTALAKLRTDSAVVEKRGEQPRALCSECDGAVSTSFGKNLVLLAKEKASYVVADTNGNVLLRQYHSGLRDGLVKASGAADSNRAAFFYIDGGIPQGGVVHFGVVDLDARKEVWAYEQKMMLNNSETASFHVVQFTPPKIALSPDGHTAAILSDGIVRIYPVP
jgi:hypothetical protein